MKIFTNKAQQIIEYILLVLAVVVILIVFLKPQGIFYRSVDNILNGSLNVMAKQNAIP